TASASDGSAVAADPGDQHAHAGAILDILVAEQADEGAFLVTARDPHGERKPSCQQQMAVAHVRCRPEGEEEAEIERVADPFVEERLVKKGVGRVAALLQESRLSAAHT